MFHKSKCMTFYKVYISITIPFEKYIERKKNIYKILLSIINNLFFVFLSILLYM